MNWHSESKSNIEEELNTNFKSGLSTSQARNRLDRHGFNQLEEGQKKSFFSRLKEEFSDFLVLILIAAAVLSYIIGEKVDSIVILVIVILNAFLSLYQEGKAEKSLDALKEMASPSATLIRDSKTQTIASKNIVPGDLIILEAGNIVPADLKIIEASNLKIDESSLTGESLAVDKSNKDILDKDISLGDRENMAYMNTIVSYGRAKGVVVSTGHDTEIGKIASQIQSLEEEETPLQKKLNDLGKTLGLVTIAISILIFVLGILQGREAIDMLMVAVSLAVAAIPEGLPAIVTIVLALGMTRMVEKHAIVKKLLAVETLGSTTVICSDKTGTLTQNEMTVRKVLINNTILDVSGNGYDPKGEFLLDGEIIDKSPELNTLLSIASLSNDANLVKEDGEYKIIGDPTEAALLTLAAKYGIYKDEINDYHPRLAEIPFDSDRKLMTTIHKNFIPDKYVSFTKGAPDILLDKSKYILLNGNIEVLTDELKSKIMEVNSKFSKSALRVLAYGYKVNDKLIENPSPSIEEDLIFVGLTGMIDPPRKEARDAIYRCHQAGIKTVMITGDYKETAFTIAKDLGIAKNENQVLMGQELNKFSEEELKELVEDISVYARVSPEHKVRIVSALKSNGHITAMTGDGVNDAPALKKADIGISMGITGSDVAKNTSEMILTDDNFSSIVSAVEEGRIIYDNIIKFVSFLLSCNIGEILIVSISILLNLPVPLLPIQLLWLNLVTDSFPALALGVEKGDPNIMEAKPRNPREKLLNKELTTSILVQSFSIAISSLAVYILSLRYYPDNLTKARSMVFTSLIMAELFRAYSSRSNKYSIFKLGIFSNKSLVYGTSFSFLLLLAVLYIPFFQKSFHTLPLNLKEWGFILVFSLIPFIVGELYKYIKNK